MTSMGHGRRVFGARVLGLPEQVGEASHLTLAVDPAVGPELTFVALWPLDDDAWPT